MHLLIYTPTITPRISYVFKFIFRDIIGLDYRLTPTSQEFEEYNGAKMSYGDSPLADELFIKAYSLLFESEITDQQPEWVHYDGYKICFPTEGSLFPFDIFSASFFLLSRYEEYLPYKPDVHSRYQAESSFAFINGFLQRPVIDEWCMTLKEVLKNKFPELSFRERTYNFLPTIDVDHPYAFREAGFLKNLGRYCRSLLRSDPESRRLIRDVFLRGKKDPYDTYRWLQNLCEALGVKPIFFFLLSNAGGFDRSLPASNKKFQNLIRQINGWAGVGLHPSYSSNEKLELLCREKSALEKIIKEDVKRSRQHYLRLHLPETYRNLVNAQISDDYSMGYASQPGFRAATCTAFLWYDLADEKETTLRVHPFAVMDVTLQQYLNLPAEQALELAKQLCTNVSNVNGTFCTLWHNESLSEMKKWKGWSKVYSNLAYFASSHI